MRRRKRKKEEEDEEKEKECNVKTREPLSKVWEINHNITQYCNAMQTLKKAPCSAMQRRIVVQALKIARG